MKTYYTLLFIFICSLSSFAQSDTVVPTPSTPSQPQIATQEGSQADSTKPMKTIFGSKGPLGWWVAPEFAWTRFNGKDGFMMGLSSGIISDHCFSVGLAGYGIVNSGSLRYSGINDTANVYLYGGYGGIRMEYRLYPLNMVNVAFPLLIGGGGVVYSTWGVDDWDDHDEHDEDEYYVWDGYFVLEPGVVVGLNLLKFMRLDTGVSYRFTSGVEMPRTDSDFLNNANIIMSLKFGKF